MSPATYEKISAAIDRLISETDSRGYEHAVEQAIEALEGGLFRNAVFRAIFLPLAGRLLPGAENLETCLCYLDEIRTKEKFKFKMLALEEPSSVQMTIVLKLFKAAVPCIRDFLEQSKRSLRPHGGGNEKLMEGVDLMIIFDEIRQIKAREGIPLSEIYPRFEHRTGLKPRTLRRKYEEDRRRRDQLNGADERQGENLIS